MSFLIGLAEKGASTLAHIAEKAVPGTAAKVGDEAKNVELSKGLPFHEDSLMGLEKEGAKEEPKLMSQEGIKNLAMKAGKKTKDFATETFAEKKKALTDLKQEIKDEGLLKTLGNHKGAIASGGINYVAMPMLLTHMGEKEGEQKAAAGGGGGAGAAEDVPIGE